MRRYSVSLGRGRAVVLLDAVEFTLRSPLDQMAMLNSLAYSVNSAYGQLLQKDIKINIHRANAEPIFLGIQSEELQSFAAARVDSLTRDAEKTGSYFVSP